MGLINVKIMVPFCRTLEEARLRRATSWPGTASRGTNGLELYMMVEIPSNVILLPEFAEYFDGFSIGSNDLTQLTLGVDRDSEIVAHVFDERDTAVQTLIAQAIEHARAARAEDRAVRPGAQRLSGVRAVSRGLRHRQHVAQSGRRAATTRRVLEAEGARGRPDMTPEEEL